MEFVRGLWSTLEPTVESRFDTIDRHILRISLELFFRGRNGRTPTAAPKQFRQLIERIISPLNLSFEAEKLSRVVLRENTAKMTHGYLHYWPSHQKREAWAMRASSRARHFSFLASGAASELLSASGLTANSTVFWWSNLGIARGLWEGQKNASELVDLWADINLILAELTKFQQTYPAKGQSFLRIGSELGATIAGLSCESCIVEYDAVSIGLNVII